VRPERHRRAGGNMIRKAMQSLETAGLLKKLKVGREITAKGKALLDATAKEIASQK
jgi:small subunit ribosomal protein S19e